MFDHLIHFAYIDAGTGSFILQATVGAVMGAIYIVRNNIRLLFAKLKRTVKADKPGN